MPKRIPRIIVELGGLAHAQSKRPKEPKSLIEYVEVMKVALVHFKMEGWGKLFFLNIFWPLFTLIIAWCASSNSICNPTVAIIFSFGYICFHLAQ